MCGSVAPLVAYILRVSYIEIKFVYWLAWRSYGLSICLFTELKCHYAQIWAERLSVYSPYNKRSILRST